MRRNMGNIAIGFCLLAWVNSLLFGIGAYFIGGTAWDGKIDDGRYFVRQKNDYKEVSPAVWHYSGIHCATVLFTLPFAIVGGVVVRFSGTGRKGRGPVRLKPSIGRRGFR